MFDFYFFLFTIFSNWGQFKYKFVESIAKIYLKRMINKKFRKYFKYFERITLFEIIQIIYINGRVLFIFAFNLKLKLK